MFGLSTIVLSVAASLLGLLAVRRRIPLHVLKEQHEVAGISFAVIGGFYGVVLAFVLVASWQRFERARDNAELEANAIGDLYQQAEGLPDPARTTLRKALVSYASSVIDVEWATMRDGQFSPQTRDFYLLIWTTVLQLNAGSPKDVALFQCLVQKLDEFGEARRYRLLYMNNGLPPVIWYFLIMFGVITVCFTYFFGMPRLLPQAIITVVLAGTIASTLFIIHEMQTPFSGLVLVPDHAFEVVLPLLQPHGASSGAP